MAAHPLSRKNPMWEAKSNLEILYIHEINVFVRQQRLFGEFAIDAMNTA